MILGILPELNVRPKARPNRSRDRRAIRPGSVDQLEPRLLLSANPTVFTVTDTSDLGTDTGSLVYAITQANSNPNPGGSLIEFSTPYFSTARTITLTGTLELSGLAGPITISGPGTGLLTVSGNNLVQVFGINSGVTAALSGLTISSGAGSNGGGLFSRGTLTLTNCTIANNAAPSGDGGGVRNDMTMTIIGCTITQNSTTGGNGGGIENLGSMTISGCTITSNSTTSGDVGGGVSNAGDMTITGGVIAQNSIAGAGYGGGVDNTGSLVVTGCTINDNSVGAGGRGGGIGNGDVMTITGSTIANNTVGASGVGGGIDNEDYLTASACTIANNSVGSGGTGGGIYNGDFLMLPDSTVADNSAGSEGGGIYNNFTLTAVSTTFAYNQVAIGGSGGGLFASGAAVTTLDDTIVALDTHLTASASVPDDIAGTVSAMSPSTYNLIGTGGAGGLTAGTGGNQVGVANPGLGSLANNGGEIDTIALLSGSPAIGKGSVALDGLAFDERGPGFLRTVNGSIDIGAYELQPAVVQGVSVLWGSAGSSPLVTAADGLRLLPPGRNTDLPWYGVTELEITFNQPETLTSANVSVSSEKGINYGPVTVTGSGESYTITLARPITTPDRVTITLAGAGIMTYVRRLDVLPGDFNDDGVVNNADFKSVKSESLGTTPVTIFGEILGDGTVDTSDDKIERKLVGKKLPREKAPTAALARSLARGSRGRPARTSVPPRPR